MASLHDLSKVDQCLETSERHGFGCLFSYEATWTAQIESTEGLIGLQDGKEGRKVAEAERKILIKQHKEAPA